MSLMSFPKILPFLFIAALVGACETPSPTTEQNHDLLPVRCIDEADLDACPGDSTGYYYDYRDNSCKPFRYGNCQVKVPFDTRDECIQVCVASGSTGAPDKRTDPVSDPHPAIADSPFAIE
ncbi:Kunitz/bovine pancreatic trypsin inhibitor-like protein [Thioflavicoccus mobilis 8321]|uniref:Kunitz/bovine pancreatic trypsin inhibitor-like protein n=2 Tax=Thioflavicoccus mobilis TaxID=80679 RepID=L0H1D9_9GAMM|nr:Kunitz/bovine pancreatic trypsin inhibitor-like protein [Thioflavicoccus mobilis 8321]